MARNKKWLGYLDSNQGMTGSKPVALPLGYTPKRKKLVVGGQIRTAEPEGADLQSAAFSHFATPPIFDYKQNNTWWRMTGSNRRPSACKADALPAELILRIMVTPTGFEPVLPP